MTEITNEPKGGHSPATLPETRVEKSCRIACELALCAMVLLVSAEVVVRLFHFSFEVVDELTGYLLSALTFLSLSVALVGGAYHRVEYLHQMLGPRGRALTNLVFALSSLGFVLVLVWQIGRLVIRSRASNVTASTVLETPLWLPQSIMLIGSVALAYSLVRVVAIEIRALRKSRETSDA